MAGAASGRDEVGGREARVALLLGGDARELRGSSLARVGASKAACTLGCSILERRSETMGNPRGSSPKCSARRATKGGSSSARPLTDSSRKAREARPKEAGDGTASRSSPRPSPTGAL